VAEYVVIARKYRPATFEQLVGQEHIARTLQNAIRCKEGPTPTPCCKCSACREIPDGACIDVIEIDGASNNSVDDVRLLRENARYSPSRDRYKVYIIDEVHMLTPQAFNALLKTLEEPPPHVKFVFATTAPERIPATILSRCQRYNFRRVGRSDMLVNLREIAQTEGIPADDEALGFIADKSGGSLRDAQSILDQARSMATERLTLKDVSKLLSVTDTAFLAEFVDALIDSDAPRVIRSVEKLFDQGVNFRSFFAELISYFHKMLLALSVPEEAQVRSVELGADEARRLVEQANKAGKNKLFVYLNRLLLIENEVARSAIPRVAFEVAALGLCHIEDVASVESLLAKLTEVQKTVAGRGGGILEPVAPLIERKQAALLGSSQAHKRPVAAESPRSTRPTVSAPRLPSRRPELGTDASAPAKPQPHKHSASPTRPGPTKQAQAKTSPKPENEKLYNASSIPIVKKALQLFDGVIEDVKTRE